MRGAVVNFAKPVLFEVTDAVLKGPPLISYEIVNELFAVKPFRSIVTPVPTHTGPSADTLVKVGKGLTVTTEFI